MRTWTFFRQVLRQFVDYQVENIFKSKILVRWCSEKTFFSQNSLKNKIQKEINIETCIFPVDQRGIGWFQFVFYVSLHKQNDVLGLIMIDASASFLTKFMYLFAKLNISQRIRKKKFIPYEMHFDWIFEIQLPLSSFGKLNSTDWINIGFWLLFRRIIRILFSFFIK